MTEIQYLHLAEQMEASRQKFLEYWNQICLPVLEKNNAMEKIQKRGFVSTGGGAMLDFLGGEKMPGIEVLEEEKNERAA